MITHIILYDKLVPSYFISIIQEFKFPQKWTKSAVHEIKLSRKCVLFKRV